MQIHVNTVFPLCRCIIKMDHHCRILCANILSRNYIKMTLERLCFFPLNTSPSAWLNNCVGHFNHRYFFSFCLFLTLGCVYCSISGRNLFLDAYNALEVSSSLCCDVCLLGCFVPLISSVPGPNYRGFPVFAAGLCFWGLSH